MVDTIRAMRDGKVQVFFAMGGNFVAATPDTEVTEDALRRCRLTVHVSTKLNRSHLVTGAPALILPTLGRTDLRPAGRRPQQFVTVEDSMGMVHASRGGAQASGRRPAARETAIVCGLARRTLGPQNLVAWEDFAADYDNIRDRIARVIPGFADFNTKIKQPGGFALPHGPRDDRAFPTATGKANFTVNELDRARGPGRSAAAADPPLARPVQHHHLRSGRPLPGHQGRPPGGPACTPRTSPSTASPRATSSTW